MCRRSIPRPVEAAAIRAAARRPAPLPAPAEVLFDRLVFACRTGDLEGVCLLGHAIVRGVSAGEDQ